MNKNRITEILILPKALHMAIFSSKETNGTTMMPEPKFPTISPNVTVVFPSVNPNRGACMDGIPGGISPISLNGV